MRIGNLGDYDSQIQSSLGSGISGRSITHTLYVSPGGNGLDGSDWAKAYTTIQDALDAASTDADDVTLIMIAPSATYYDINTTGDPTWSANVELEGVHRAWVQIRNTRASATSVMNFTGRASLSDLVIYQSGSLNGVSFTGNGARVRHCGFNSESLSGAATCIYLNGSAALTQGAIIQDVQMLGNVSYTKAIRINKSRVNEINEVRIHAALVGIHQEDVLSVKNYLYNIVIGGCALGIDIDGGTNTHMHEISFHQNTRNIDDEVGGHHYRGIESDAPITLYPDNFTGVTLSSAAGADTWGTLTDLIAANVVDNPFRIVAFVFEPAVSQWSRIRLTGDGGSIYFDDVLFDANKQSGVEASRGTDFVFNANVAIKGQAKVEGTGPDNIIVWLKVQLI